MASPWCARKVLAKTSKHHPALNVQGTMPNGQRRNVSHIFLLRGSAVAAVPSSVLACSTASARLYSWLAGWLAGWLARSDVANLVDLSGYIYIFIYANVYTDCSACSLHRTNYKSTFRFGRSSKALGCKGWVID